MEREDKLDWLLKDLIFIGLLPVLIVFIQIRWFDELIDFVKDWRLLFLFSLMLISSVVAYFITKYSQKPFSKSKDLLLRIGLLIGIIFWVSSIFIVAPITIIVLLISSVNNDIIPILLAILSFLSIIKAGNLCTFEFRNLKNKS